MARPFSATVSRRARPVPPALGCAWTPARTPPPSIGRPWRRHAVRGHGVRHRAGLEAMRRNRACSSLAYRPTRRPPGLPVTAPWQADWAEHDQERDWVTMGAGFPDRRRPPGGDRRARYQRFRRRARKPPAASGWPPDVGVDLAQDVALLRIKGEPGQPVAIAPAMPPQGCAVAAVGSPNGWGFRCRPGW